MSVENNQISQAKAIMGSRVLPKYIMYDGEGKYVRKYIKDNVNHQEQINLDWKKSLEIDDNDQFKFEKITSVNSSAMMDHSKNQSESFLPKIRFNRMVIQYETYFIACIKRSLANETNNNIKYNKIKELIDQYGKYTYRYNEHSDIFRLQETTKVQNIKNGYRQSSEKYGQFYFQNEQPGNHSGLISNPIELQKQTPTKAYKSFDVEKPITKYNNLKSQLFKYEKL